MVAGTADAFSHDDRLVLGAKSLDRLVVVIISSNGASICIPPSGHERWKEETVGGDGECRTEIDAAVIRRKYFEERLDLAALLQP